ncbi:MAG: SH3 domain-containing protein [Desmonostoc vinosum HA7617-LM4]|jgi:hypothetical protein|nr:SH3 domain-containing protein [Desmonostoc vinosum HA7617-LM4]
MLSNLLKFILGFSLAIAVLMGTGFATALYFMNRTAIPPAKPIFANDNPQAKGKDTKQAKAETTSNPKSEAQAESSPTSTKSPEATPSAKPLPSGAYRGRVSWSEGLILRSEPRQEGQRIGGVAFNQKIIVLEESKDKTWQKIRIEDGEQEGWVKAGNTQKVDEQEEAEKPEEQ